MSEDPILDDLLARVADGEDVDWDRLEREAADPEVAGLLRQLRIVATVGGEHRQTGTPTSEALTSPAPIRADGAATAESFPEYWGHFRLIRAIGRGSYGVVYLARDEALDRDVAIKLLHPSIGGRADVRAEGKALAKVAHDNIVSVYHAEEFGGRFGLCMKYIHGRTLDDIVRADGPMSADEATIVGQALCPALAELHRHKIIHRDVKARNVMREHAGRYVLMDLGAGLDLAQADAGGEVSNIGTPLYMAPELFERGRPSAQSDVYSLGVLLHFLVTGQYPVSGSVAEIRDAHRKGARVSLDDRRPDLRQSFVRAVERATAPRPEDRFSSAMALLRELDASKAPAQAQPVVAPPEGWRTRVWRWARVLAGGVVLVMAFGLLTTWTFNAVIDRPAAFDPDTLAVKFGVGLQSIVFPAIVMAVLLAVASPIGFLLRIFPAPKRWWTAAWRSLLPADLKEEDFATALAQVALVIGFVAVGIALLIFGDVIQAFVSNLSTDDLERFRAFESPRPILYRTTTAALILVAALGWRAVRRVRQRRGGAVPSWVRAIGAVLVGLLVVLCQAPYKVLVDDQNQAEVALVDGLRCYVLGAAEQQVRVFCPAVSVPRVRSLAVAAHRLEMCGFQETVFLAVAEPATCDDKSAKPGGDSAK